MKEIILAEEEYRKHPDLKREAVQELAEWIRQNPEYPPVHEEQVIRFLFSCYYNIKNAKKCVHYYYTIRLNNLPAFLERDVLREELQAQLNVVQFAVMKNKTPKDYTVVLHRLKVFEPSQYNFHHACRLFTMMAEALLWREGNMTGIVVIFDMKGVSFMHLFRCGLAPIKSFLHYVQEAIPVRLKAVHVVNTLPIAAKLMMIIKPFLKNDLINLIQFHSDKVEEIHEFLPLDCLPSDFGGTQPSIEQLHDEYKKWMLDLRELFIEEDKELKDFLKQRSELNEQKKSLWDFF